MKRRHRYLAGLAALALAAAALLGWAAGTARLASLERAAVARARTGTEVVAMRLPSAVPDALASFAAAHASPLLARVTLIGLDGRVLAESALPGDEVAAMDDHRDRPEIRQAALAGFGAGVRRSSTTGVEYLYAARRVAGAEPVGFVRLALPWGGARREARGYAVAVALRSLLAIALVASVAYMGLRRRERAIRRFAGAVERAVDTGEALDDGGLGAPYLDEVGAAIGSLRGALDARYREVAADRALLASVVSGMREGLLLVDAERRVRLANAAVREILAIDFDPHGRHVTEAVRHPAVIEEIDAAFADGGERSESTVRVAATGRAFNLHTVTLDRGAGDDEVLVLFFDTTRLERLERVRREFVANVSHELRTPLTSILAFVETLLDGGLDDPDEARRFLGIVRKHAERMGELIEDLTDLSLIETGAIRLEPEQLDGAAAVRDVVARLAPLIERRGLQVELDLPRPCPLRADRRRLEQVLMNLVDNAVKFSRAGGTIRVEGRCEAQRTTIRVIDEGIGIAADAHESIFHRFHRERREQVDGADELRGTGLGLAIVKHLMRLHGGSVRVDSELGHGASFSVEFPWAAEPGPPSGLGVS